MKLTAYNWTQSAGMTGCLYSTSISYTEDHRCKVETISRSRHDLPTTYVTYYAEGLLEKMNEVCERYNVSSWTDLPYQKINMLDAASSITAFTFENKTIVTLESERIYSNDVFEMVQEISNLIDESKTYGMDKETVEKPNETMGMFGFPISMMNFHGSNHSNEDTGEWAKFCVSCGTEFTGEQKFCPNCGSVRKKM